jgi:hypothetical protein
VVKGEVLMARSTLGDLNLHLFAQLERLGDEDIKGDKLREEINRAEAVTAVAQQIISNGALVLKVKQLSVNKFDSDMQIPKMLEG